MSVLVIVPAHLSVSGGRGVSPFRIKAITSWNNE